MPKITLIRPIGRDRIGKPFDLDDSGALISGAPLFPAVCKAEVLSFDSLRGYAEFVQLHSGDSWCALYSTPRTDGKAFALIPEEARRSKSSEGQLLAASGLEALPVLTRTQAALHYVPGLIFLPIDYDPPDASEHSAGHPWSAERVWQSVLRLAPELAFTPRFFLPSTSAFLTVDGEIKRGARGVRIMTLAKLPTACSRNPHGAREYMKILHRRLILAGICWPKIDRAGNLHLRTPIDLALYVVTQPNFLGAPWFKNPRIARQRLPVEYIPGEGQIGDAEMPFDLEKVQALTEQENQAVEAVVADFKRQFAKPMQVQAEAWHTQMDEREFVLHQGKIDRPTLRQRRRACLDKGDHTLPLSHAIHVDHVGWRSGYQLIADPMAWHGKTCASPMDWLSGSPDGIQPGRHKGKIAYEAGEIVVIDYASGNFTRYHFADDRKLEAFLARIEDEATMPNDGATLTQRIEDPPPVLRRIPLPTVRPADYGQETRNLLSQDGLALVAGLDFQRQVISAAVRHGPTLIAVTDYAAARRMREWVHHNEPGTSVMIMPGRSSDAVKYRTEFGRDIFAYPTPFGKAWDGFDDDICPKRALVNRLHALGLMTISRHACALRVTQDNRTEFRGHRVGDLIECPDGRLCGYNQRQAAKARADVIVYVAHALLGPDNPLLDGSGQRPVRAVLVDLTDRPLAETLVWQLSSWEKIPPLAKVLALLRTGRRQGRMPAGLMSELMAWAGLPKVRPDMSLAQGLQAVECYQQRR